MAPTNQPDNRFCLTRIWQDTFWNSEKKEFLGRTGASWGKIGFFYLIFYAILAGFFAVWIAIFLETLDAHEPRFHGKDSILGSQPGVGFRPHADHEKNLIWFSNSQPETYMPYVDDLHKFLTQFDSVKDPERTFDACKSGNGTGAPEGKVCRFDWKTEMKDLVGDDKSCKRDKEFGFTESKPCIVLKMNKIFGWEPKQFKNSDDSRIPKSAKDRWDEGSVLVSCEGMNAADKENLGTVKYAPSSGFPFRFFPYKNVDYYQQPLVMVQFENPKKNVLINVECKVYLENVEHDRTFKQGLAVFELMID